MDYEDSLDRALTETPEVGDAADRFQVPDPEVRPEGNVTSYENFAATLDRLNRDEAHLLKFLQSELGTSASIDDRLQAVPRRRRPRRVRRVVRDVFGVWLARHSTRRGARRDGAEMRRVRGAVGRAGPLIAVTRTV
jgi:translation initiation factor 2 beta subunit (eIF-2beta)/eIF-5